MAAVTSWNIVVYVHMFFYAFIFGDFVNNRNQKIGDDPHYIAFLTLPDPQNGNRRKNIEGDPGNLDLFPPHKGA